MANLGQITNTRTIESALTQTIVDLEQLEQTSAVVRVLSEARRYHGMLTGWSVRPPSSGSQFEVIAEIMQLMGRALQMTGAVKRGAKSEAGPSAGSTGAGRTSDRPSRPPADRGSERGRKLGRVTLSKPPSGDQTDEVPSSSGGAPIRLVRSYMRAWREVSALPGVRVKRMTEGGVGCPTLALVRLDRGAELPGHLHGSAEHVMTLDGCVVHGETPVHAGECVCISAGATSGALRSRGESTLLLIGSDREWLRASEPGPER